LPWLNSEVSDGASILEAVQQSGANCLLGLSTIPGIFNEDVVKAALANHPAPIVMPMSNPTSKSECTPAQAYEWTDGAAVVATGSPFPPHTLPSGKVVTPSQCNNMYVFPGLGLAASVGGVSTITDRMLYLAALACSETMTEAEISEGRTFPNLDRIRDVSHAVACAVVEEALAEGLCSKIKGDLTADEISELVSSKMYYPQYTPLVQQS